MKKSGDAHRGEEEWACRLSRWVGAAALARALPVRQLPEQLEKPELELQEPQKQERQVPPELREPEQQPASHGVAQRYRKKK